MDIVYTLGWVFLREVLLRQIELMDFLGKGLEFRWLLVQDLSLHTLIQLLALCIVDSEIDLITFNRRLRLASNNVNPDIFDQFLF